MRPAADQQRIRALAEARARVARAPVTVYLTGGATAVLEGWRASTVDVDVRFDQDLADARRMIEEGLVEPDRLRELYDAIEPNLFRYPAVDGPAFRRRLEDALSDLELPGERPARAPPDAAAGPR